MGEARITNWRDLPWQDVKRLQLGDRTVSAREKWMEFSPRYLSLYAEWDPGMIIQPHGHRSDHIVFVLDGDMRCGEVHCPAGTHIALDHGDVFGPFVAGEQGCKLYMIMMGDPRSFPVDPDGFRIWLEARGASPLPNPSIDMPLWLKDARS